MTNDSRTDPDGASAPFDPTPPAGGRGRRRRSWLLVALIGGLVLGAVSLFPGLVGLSKPGDGGGALTYTASRNPLQVTVTADGNVESASNLEVKCRVAGGSTILWIVEDGRLVEEGEEIVKLDTSAIDDKLNSQRIVYEKALAAQIQAQEDLDAARIGVKEYEEGTFIELLKQVEAQVQIALENLRSAENQLKYTTRMVRKGFVSSLQREADEFAVERAKLDLDAASTRKKVLVEFSREKTLKELVAKREASAARLRSEEAALQLEKARLDRLQDQLKNCVITAPKKGMVVYANDSRRDRFGGSSERSSQVEEGAMVRESQALVRLPDLSRMQVRVAVHETRVEQVRPGLPAQVVIQDQEYAGKVISIANQPQAGSWYSASVKEYATTVAIAGESTGLRPGMTAKVTILVASLPEALTVPVSAVVSQRGQYFCWVSTPRGPERRPLKLGRTNDKLIEVVD
ncbi:MAG: efflux RND transporter periplasmic adaptor subunit, partial [Anaerolineales bacterium]